MNSELEKKLAEVISRGEQLAPWLKEALMRQARADMYISAGHAALLSAVAIGCLRYVTNKKNHKDIDDDIVKFLSIILCSCGVLLCPIAALINLDHALRIFLNPDVAALLVLVGR